MASTVDETFRELVERVQSLEAEIESLRKQLAESEQERNSACEALKQVNNEYVALKRADRDGLSEALTEQRRQLGALHDETIVELKRVRQVAGEEIETLRKQLGEPWDEAMEVVHGTIAPYSQSQVSAAILSNKLMAALTTAKERNHEQN